MTKDQWIQKAKALFFDCTMCVDASSIRKEINELLDQGGGYDYRKESSKTPLRWVDKDRTAGYNPAMNITSAYVIVGRGPDHVSLTTDLEPAIGWELHSTETMHLRFEATAHQGHAYIKKHFSVPVEVLDLNEGTLASFDANGNLLSQRKVG